MRFFLQSQLGRNRTLEITESGLEMTIAELVQQVGFSFDLEPDRLKIDCYGAMIWNGQGQSQRTDPMWIFAYEKTIRDVFLTSTSNFFTPSDDIYLVVEVCSNATLELCEEISFLAI